MDAPIRHAKSGPGSGDRNLRIYEKQLKQGAQLDARQTYYYGRELLDNGRYDQADKVLEEFLTRKDAWTENQIDACRQLAVCRYRQKKDEEALEALLQGLTFDEPRAETCCDIGRHFFDRGRYPAAVFWYRAALLAQKRPQGGGFVDEDCYGFLPCISLCLCCDRMGDMVRARRYNEMAGKFRPQSPYYLHNLEYFGKYMEKQKNL